MAQLTDEKKEVIKDATENVTLVGRVETLEVPDFWTKHKNKAWVAILLAVGALGGNVDELYKAIPDVHGVTELKVQVKELRSDVDDLMRVTPSNVFRTPVPPLPEPVDDGFKVERPTK